MIEIDFFFHIPYQESFKFHFILKKYYLHNIYLKNLCLLNLYIINLYVLYLHIHNYSIYA